MAKNLDKIRIITQENVPWWYELDWLSESNHGPAITIRIRKELLTKEVFALRPEIIAHLQKVNELPDFIAFTDHSSNCGFGGCLLWTDNDSESRTLLIPIPVIEKFSDRLCRTCKGTGRSHSHDRCFECNGKRKERIIDWSSAYSISASLTVLFMCLDFPEITWESEKYQLITLSTITQRGPHGGSLGGKYSLGLVNWMAQLPLHAQIDDMVKAMKTTYWKMLGERQQFRSIDRFGARIDGAGGWLNVDCPGDACGLNPHHAGPRPGRGYEWSDHNVDTPMQQLTLIAGLAALHRLARSEGVL